MKNIIGVTVITLFLSNLSFSNENPCTIKNGGAPARLLCLAPQIEKADKTLNQTYQEAIQRVQEEEKHVRKFYTGFNIEDDFREAQRAWLKYRNSICNFEGKVKTQSPWQAVQIEECNLQYTQERIKYFRQVLVG